jgi:nuclear pore complex protein Nup54
MGTLAFQTVGTQGAAASAPDDSALKELQSIQDSYLPSPGNHRYRFQYLFLNVVENPAARVKPAEVDELQWREALRRAGGPDNPDRLWPVQAQGFKGLLARKAAQDEAIKEHSERLQALQQGVASLTARHEAILKTQFEAVKKKHAALCQQLLRVLRYVSFFPPSIIYLSDLYTLALILLYSVHSQCVSFIVNS